ncbi:MAG: small basic protein [Planctomycetota bacterium]|nr:MAG: small basic protein [Planctomycetota bacterium]
MSIHKSLFIGGASTEKRSVFTRRERIERLQKEGRWSEEESVFGVVKVRTAFKSAVRKPKKAAAEGAQPAAAAPAGEAGKAEAAKPAAAGSKPGAAAGGKAPAAGAKAPAEKKGK